MDDHPLPEALLRDPRSSLVLGRFDGQHPLALAAPATGLWDLRVELADGRRTSFRIDQAQEAQWTPAASPILLRLTAAVALAGRIVDAGGRHALPGALVWPADDPGSLTQTDAAGVYRLAGRVPGSRCELRAAAAGYKPGQLKVGLPSRPPESLRKAPDLPLVFSPVPAVLGVVVDEAARPVAGAEIRLVRPDPEVIVGPPESRLATTGPDGGFRIAPLEPGGFYADGEPGGLCAGDAVRGRAAAAAERSSAPPRLDTGTDGFRPGPGLAAAADPGSHGEADAVDPAPPLGRRPRAGALPRGDRSRRPIPGSGSARRCLRAAHRRPGAGSPADEDDRGVEGNGPLGLGHLHAAGRWRAWRSGW